MVARHLGPLLERHKRSIDVLRQRAEARDGVIYFDVSDLDLEGYNKFIPYLLFPHCVLFGGRQRVAHAREDFPGVESVERCDPRRRIWRRWRSSMAAGAIRASRRFRCRRETSSARARLRKRLPQRCARRGAVGSCPAQESTL